MKIGDKRFLLATVEDVMKALEVYSELFETTRTGTEQRILRFYHDLVKTKETWYLKEITYEYNSKNEKKKLSSGRIGEMLQRLSEIGYVDIDKDTDDKRLNIYRPLIKEPEKPQDDLLSKFLSLKDKDEKSRISLISEIETLLKSKLKEGLENWRKNYLEDFRFHFTKNFSENTWGEAEISWEEAQKIILEGPFIENFSDTHIEETSRYISKEDSEAKPEKNPETISIPKIEIFRDNSEEWIAEREGNRITTTWGEIMFQCLLCKDQNKQSFWSSEHDLKLHTERIHSPSPNYVR